MEDIKVGDIISIGNSRSTQRTGKVTKILPVKDPSPGGFVAENSDHIFWVAPWERITIQQTNHGKNI